MRGLALSALLITAAGAYAQPEYYNGDGSDFSSAIVSGYNTDQGSAIGFENFMWTSTNAAKYVMGTFEMNYTPTMGHYEIRQGMSVGNGGTLIASGDAPIVSAVDLGFGSSSGEAFRLTSLIPDAALIQGQDYWIGFAPIGTGQGSSSVMLFSTGGNAVGTPILDNQSIFHWPNNSINYADGNSFQNPSNYSLGIGSQPVPEPASMAVLGLGALALIRKRRSK